MNVDEAIRRAADHIERYPEHYEFMQGMVINDRKFGHDNACMLSRIGQMAGMRHGLTHNAVARRLMQTTAQLFYEDIGFATCGPSQYGPGHLMRYAQLQGALHNTKTIPTAMRVVAKKYVGIPISVRAITDGMSSDDSRTDFLFEMSNIYNVPYVSNRDVIASMLRTVRTRIAELV
jgi:hypothetical protein